MDKLKPCPFCGEQPKVYDPKGRRIAWHVFCDNCSCEGPVSFGDELVETRQQAIDTWNRRATEKPLPEIDGSAMAALVVAERHIVHMAAWISKHNTGYSFEGLHEDKWIIDQALAAHSPNTRKAEHD